MTRSGENSGRELERLLRRGGELERVGAAQQAAIRARTVGASSQTRILA